MSNFLKNCSAGILAGGENRRMPALKGFIEIDGEKIIERNLRMMKQLFREVFIVTDQPEKYVHSGIRLLGDIHDIRSPMTGIFTSLVNTSSDWVFISACDMPFISRELIEFMGSERSNCDAVVPEHNSGMEPLFAFYSKRLLPFMEKALFSGKRGLRDFLTGENIRIITFSDIRRIDRADRSFININTPEDLYKVTRLDSSLVHHSSGETSPRRTAKRECLNFKSQAPNNKSSGSCQLSGVGCQLITGP